MTNRHNYSGLSPFPYLQRTVQDDGEPSEGLGDFADFHLGGVNLTALIFSLSI